MYPHTETNVFLKLHNKNKNQISCLQCFEFYYSHKKYFYEAFLYNQYLSWSIIKKFVLESVLCVLAMYSYLN